MSSTISCSKKTSSASQVQDGADDKAHDERDGDNRTGQRAIAVDELSELVTLIGLVMSCQFSFPFGLVVRSLIGVAGYGTVIGILGWTTAVVVGRIRIGGVGIVIVGTVITGTAIGIR